MAFTRQWYTGRKQNCQYIGQLKYQSITNAMQCLVIFTDQKECNAIFGDLHRAKRMFADFGAEVTYVIEKFWKGNFPLRSINNIVPDFIKWTSDLEDTAFLLSKLSQLAPFRQLAPFYFVKGCFYLLLDSIKEN